MNRVELPVVETSAVALNLPPNMPFDTWADFGRRLGLVAQACTWWLGDWWAYGDHRYGERAATVFDESWQGPTFGACRNAGSVARAFPPEARREELTFTHHKAVAALETSPRGDVLDQAVAEGWGKREVEQAVRRIKAAERIGKAADVAEDLAALDEYQVLYADPPWRYEDAGATRAVENHYPTMTLGEICALEPPAANDSMLFLWATSPKLRESMDVLDAWGFTYRTCMVWVKGTAEDPTIGMGYYARQAHEQLLIAKRGDLPCPAPPNRPASVVEAPRREHSAKPERFYRLIETMYPSFSRCELFARGKPREGWHTWGNQALPPTAAAVTR